MNFKCPTSYPLESVHSILKEEEGFSSTAYKDSRGFLTIGYGRLIDDRVPNSGITKEEGSYLLRSRVIGDIARLNKRIPWFQRLDDARKVVLLSMAYQMGVDGLLKFEKTLLYLYREEYDKAAKEMLNSRWAGQTIERALRHSYTIKTGVLNA